MVIELRCDEPDAAAEAPETFEARLLVVVATPFNTTDAGCLVAELLIPCDSAKEAFSDAAVDAAKLTFVALMPRNADTSADAFVLVADALGRTPAVDP